MVIFEEQEECKHSENKKNFWNASNVLDLGDMAIMDTSTSLSCTFMSFILFSMYSFNIKVIYIYKIYFKDLQNASRTMNNKNP